MKKKIEVPFVPSLDDVALENLGGVMDNCAAKHSIDQLNWPKEFPYTPITDFYIARSNKYIYINYNVRGNYLRAVNSKNNSPVWQDSCVEFFVQIPGCEGYYNFEFNCIGACLAAFRESRERGSHFNDEKIATIKRYSSIGPKPFEEMQGNFAWELLIAVPFDLLGLDGENLPEMINANFYKCADGSSLPHYLSWSPIDLPAPNFHCPEFFGELYFK